LAGLDFTQLSSTAASDTATEPRRIFSALPSKDPKYSYARDVQSEVWEAWHKRREDRDLVIKMNTGGGKTVVGLVTLKACLNEQVGPAAYIAPDRYLADQVRAEAEKLGLETADDPDSAHFRRGSAILVTNIHKLFNGLSVFGVRGAPRSSIDLGTVLMDDAHACLAKVKEKFSLFVPGDHAAYDELVELFSDSLSAQSEPGYRDLLEGDSSAVLPVPYWDWIDRQEQAMTILHPHRDDGDLKFAWPLIADFLPTCAVAVSTDGVEIAPPCPPVEMVPSFDRARRRIYLTATLADDSVLVTHFAADPDSVRVPVTPRSADDLGDRMILTPSQTFPEAGEDEIRDFVVEQATDRNVVVIVPSWARAISWEPVAADVLGADGLHEGLERLRAGHVGLVVLVNKYDGIDLPDDACHLLVLDRLPEAQGNLDRLETIALDGSETLLGRQVQRIEQGMGRGVRSNEDYCAVLLLGRRLADRLYPSAARAKFSPATRAQLDLSDQIASLLDGKPFTELRAVIDQCLERDPTWVAASRNVLDGLVYPEQSRISPIAEAERGAFEAAAGGRGLDASARLQKAIDGASDPLLRGLLKQQAAAYLHGADPVAARRLQLSAFEDNREVARPPGGVEYVHLREPGVQAQAAAKYLNEQYDGPEALLFGFNALLEQLVPHPDPDAVPRFEQAMLDLGLHLGFAAQRPERDSGRGPDVLWSLGEKSYLVIECKSGSEAGAVSKSDMAQLSQSTAWFEESYDSSCEATPVLIHPSRKLHEKASAIAGSRVITFDKLKKLREAAGTFATAIAHDGVYADPAKVSERLAALRLNAPALADHWTTAVGR
jgi:DEAD/DEAH box helicase/Helicase C-terminal domain